MGRCLRTAHDDIGHICPLCPGMHLGDERHGFAYCPSLGDICHSRLFDGSHGAMRLFMCFHPHQKRVCILLVADAEYN